MFNNIRIIIFGKSSPQSPPAGVLSTHTVAGQRAGVLVDGDHVGDAVGPGGGGGCMVGELGGVLGEYTP